VFSNCQQSPAFIQKLGLENGKIIQHLIVSACICSTEQQTRPGSGFFPSHQREKHKETSAKQGMRAEF